MGTIALCYATHYKKRDVQQHAATDVAPRRSLNPTPRCKVQCWLHAWVRSVRGEVTPLSMGVMQYI